MAPALPRSILAARRRLPNDGRRLRQASYPSEGSRLFSRIAPATTHSVVGHDSLISSIRNSQTRLVMARSPRIGPTSVVIGSVF